MSVFICELFYVLIVLFLVFPGVYSPLYKSSVFCLLYPSVGHRSPVFNSTHWFISFTCCQLVSPPPTPYMGFLPVLCPRCSPLFLVIPQCLFNVNPSVSASLFLRVPKTFALYCKCFIWKHITVYTVCTSKVSEALDYDAFWLRVKQWGAFTGR